MTLQNSTQADSPLNIIHRMAPKSKLCRGGYLDDRVHLSGLSSGQTMS